VDKLDCVWYARSTVQTVYANGPLLHPQKTKQAARFHPPRRE